ncbi:glutamate receptor ionotropic, delta-1-like [Limulus polyphemus]|uniref:Glutamate receptor ionotropic, delta-1-like n=1 Tax=Limulus polyphemus TaxID=6850 RepID=A0ABM1SJR7_LIMPO|nr:glutamate receptor ionotropic, delta-1-like [Limulus polyphemus]
MIMSSTMAAIEEGSLLNTSFFVKPRLNLHNRTLQIASVHRVPFQNITTLPNGGYQASGFIFEIVNHLAHYFNFSYNIVIPEDNSFGKLVKHENGTESWNGMMRLLLDKKVDLAAGPFTVNVDRRRVVNFSETLFSDDIGVLVKKPEKKDNTEKLLAPFTLRVWCAIILATIFMGLTLFGVLCLQTYLLCSGEESGEKYNYSLSKCMWFVYSGLVKQGAEDVPISDSVRILFATWWMFTLLVTAFYTGNLTAFLTSSVYKLGNSLESVLNDPTTKWLVDYGSALDSAIEFPTDTSFRQLHASRLKGKCDTTEGDDEAVILVEKGGYIFFREVNVLNYLIRRSFRKHRGKCVLTKGWVTFYRRQNAIPYAPDSLYAEDFNLMIKQLRAAGLIEKWKEQYFPNMESCFLSRSKSFNTQEEALSVFELASAFYLYSGGVALGIAVLIIENVWRNIFGNNKNDSKMAAWLKR